jgi:hypothetical protein
MDSLQRPSAAALGLVGERERGGESGRSSFDATGGGGIGPGGPGKGGNAADILADLEALQREVDAARASAGR